MEALAATLAKSQEARRVFDVIFDGFFFRAALAARRLAGALIVDSASNSPLNGKRHM